MVTFARKARDFFEARPMVALLVVAAVAGVLALVAWQLAAAWFAAGASLVTKNLGASARGESALDELRERQEIHDRVVRDLQADADDLVRDNAEPVTGDAVDDLVDEANEILGGGSL